MPNSFSLTHPTDEFDLGRCVRSGQTFRWEELSDSRWLGVDGPTWFHVRAVNRTPQNAESADATSSLGGSLHSSAHLDRSRHIENRSVTYSIESSGADGDFIRLFRLDWHSNQIERSLLERGPELEPFLGALRGLRIMKQSDPYEVLFSFLCTPNNNIRRITGMVRRLAGYGEPIGSFTRTSEPPLRDVSRAGRRQAVGEESQPSCEFMNEVRRFPPPERVAAIPEEELRSAGFGWRARTIPAAARALLAKPDGWLESLREASYKGAHEELCSVPGIGPKLADCIALFGLHHMEAVPIDTHMWQAACRLYFAEWRGAPLTSARYRQFGDFFRDRFGDLAGWAHQYLFFENVLNWRTRRGNEPKTSS